MKALILLFLDHRKQVNLIFNRLKMGEDHSYPSSQFYLFCITFVFDLNVFFATLYPEVLKIKTRLVLIVYLRLIKLFLFNLKNKNNQKCPLDHAVYGSVAILLS